MESIHFVLRYTKQMITMNTYFLIQKNASEKTFAPAPSGQPVVQVSLLTLMVGNLLEKSLALAAILTATWRATAL